MTLDLRAHRGILARAGEDREVTGVSVELGAVELGETAAAGGVQVDAAPSGLPGAGA